MEDQNLKNRVEDLEFKLSQISDAYYKYNFQGSQAITKDTTVQSGFLQSGNFRSGVTGWQIQSNGNAEFQNVNIGTKIITIDNTQDLQTSLDLVESAGGGILNLKAGTYTVNSAITAPSNVQIVGINKGTTIIDFNGTSANLSFAGESVYSTGTITGITSGVNVTGSGTSWLANVTAGQHLFINTRWYQIAAVTGDTTLVLAESYGDSETLPISYRIATPAQNIAISRLTLKNSTGSAISITDGRDIELADLLLLDNNVGLTMTNCSYATETRVTSVSNTSHGYDINNSSLVNFEYCASAGNGGNGFDLNNLEACPFTRCSSTSNTGDGFNCTTMEGCAFAVEASGNGSNGIEFVSNCDGCFINNSIVSGNTSDGIKLTATADGNTIGSSLNLVGNGGYGINIAASTCDGNTTIAPFYSGNSSGTLSDSGTGTVIIPSTTAGSPVATITQYAGSSAPSGWLLCDGATVSQSTYSSLYSIVGHTYGADPGGGNFILPNLKGKVAVGYNSAETEFDALGETGGAKTHSLSIAELASHNHGERHEENVASYYGSNTGLQGVAGVANKGGSGRLNTDSTGSGTAHNNLQPYITLNYIIKT